MFGGILSEGKQISGSQFEVRVARLGQGASKTWTADWGWASALLEGLESHVLGLQSQQARCHSTLSVEAVKTILLSGSQNWKALTPTPNSQTPFHKQESLLHILRHRCSGHSLCSRSQAQTLEKKRVGCASGLSCRWGNAHHVH